MVEEPGVDDPEWAVDEFYLVLARQDDIGKVILTHIHIEQRLNEFIESLVIDVEALNKLRLNFEGRVRLAIALGLHPRIEAPLLNLGKLRNAFAHRLDMSLSKERMDEMYSTFDPDEKEVIQSTFNRTRSTHARKVQKRINTLDPSDRFSLYAVSLRAALTMAISEVEEAQQEEYHEQA